MAKMNEIQYEKYEKEDVAMNCKNSNMFTIVYIVAILFQVIGAYPAMAHDPIFALGPHVLFEGGIETSVSLDRFEGGNSSDMELRSKAVYGITGDWAAGVDIPYIFKDNGANIKNDKGFGNIGIFTKYRFWRKDSLGIQKSASAFAKIDFDTANESVGSGTNDAVLGLAYGYESSKWYRWLSSRYRINGRTDSNIDRGDKFFIDAVIGVRPKPITDYYKADTVVMLELNAEYTQKSSLSGSSLANTGGEELFISPGIFWTYRNFAVKSGVQFPVYSNLNGNQNSSDYRASLTLELHF